MTDAVAHTDPLTLSLKTVWDYRERTKLRYFLRAIDRRTELLNAIKTLQKENQLSPTRSEICKKLNLSSAELLWRDIDALECTNYLTVYKGVGRKTKSRNMVPKSVYNVPVLYSDNATREKSETKVDIRLFSAPPHYAIELANDIDGLGCKGTIAFIHSPVFLKKGSVTIVEKHGGVFSFRKVFSKLPVKPNFQNLFDGLVVGTISPISI